MVPTKKYVFGSLPGCLLLMWSLFCRGPLFLLTPDASAKPACLLHDTPTRSEKRGVLQALRQQPNASLTGV
jgi:hypothetical protein